MDQLWRTILMTNSCALFFFIPLFIRHGNGPMARIEFHGLNNFQTPLSTLLRREYINTRPPTPLSSVLLFAYWLRSSVVPVLSSLITGSLALPGICYYPSFCC